MTPNIHLTTAAENQMSKQVQQEGCTAMRLSLRAAGCSGLEYILEYTNEAQAKDLSLSFEAFTLFIDSNSYEQALNGLQVDFQQDLLSSAFVYQNPNKKGECGCGISFTV
ncbi:MAG: iron-sulfur cluster assembly accessory protein [Mariprofundaceae bacterium]|nr:iron-sulfur cluster assembly accessory protein [Mariprofundaceae bacterium]